METRENASVLSSFQKFTLTRLTFQSPLVLGNQRGLHEAPVRSGLYLDEVTPNLPAVQVPQLQNISPSKQPVK